MLVEAGETCGECHHVACAESALRCRHAGSQPILWPSTSVREMPALTPRRELFRSESEYDGGTDEGRIVPKAKLNKGL